MSSVKGKGTILEKRGMLLLKQTGVRFRKNPKGIFGNPDAANKKRKIAVFFDSEFWHGYRWKTAQKNIKSNRTFWIKKIEKNIKRDRVVNKLLKEKGWIVIRIWEKDLKGENHKKTLHRIIKYLPPSIF